jgi:hypothetical protein
VDWEWFFSSLLVLLCYKLDTCKTKDPHRQPF